MSDLGERVREMREALELTKSALAAAAAVSPQYIHDLEGGRYPDPRLSTCVRLADALGCSLDDLAGRKPPRRRRRG